MLRKENSGKTGRERKVNPEIEGKSENDFMEMIRQRVQVERRGQRSNQILHPSRGWKERVQHGGIVYSIQQLTWNRNYGELRQA